MKIPLVAVAICTTVYLQQVFAQYEIDLDFTTESAPEMRDQEPTTLPPDVEDEGPPISERERKKAKKLDIIEPTPEQLEEIENQGKFEGDMEGVNHEILKEEEEGEKVLNDQVAGKLAKADVNGAKRLSKQIQNAALRDKKYLWSSNKIPYKLSHRFNETQRLRIAKAFDEFHTKTCVRFVPKDKVPDETAYLYIAPLDGCFSYVGKQYTETYGMGPRPQGISLSPACVEVHGIILHELMHALGFFHEQARADRDRYVKVNFENIDKDEFLQFDKYSLRKIRHLGVAYDYESVMHYYKGAFSKNGKPTIEKLNNPDEPPKLGQRRKLSDRDVEKLNRLFSCTDEKPCMDRVGTDLCERLKAENYCQFSRYRSFTKKECWKTCHNCKIRKKRCTKRRRRLGKCGNKDSKSKKSGSRSGKRPAKDTGKRGGRRGPKKCNSRCRRLKRNRKNRKKKKKNKKKRKNSKD
jgi:hypothetical protein